MLHNGETSSKKKLEYFWVLLTIPTFLLSDDVIKKV